MLFEINFENINFVFWAYGSKVDARVPLWDNHVLSKFENFLDLFYIWSYGFLCQNLTFPIFSSYLDTFSKFELS